MNYNKLEGTNFVTS